MRLTLADIAQCLGVHAQAPDTPITGVAIDSREVKPGDLFVCLPGERTDGHVYAEQAAKAGAAAVLAEKPLSAVSVPVLIVENTERALGKLASFWRSRATSKVICLTGTAGKTTLKDALAAILAEAGSVAFTKGNHNNQIGLPLTILNSTGDEDFWVLEAGISHAGDMEYLGAIARPDTAIILNAGEGHTAGLGEKGVVWHKTRLLEFLAPGGTAIINADYPKLLAQARASGVNIASFGSAAPGCLFSLLKQENGTYEITGPGGLESYRTPFTAHFGREIVLAAVTTASLLAITPEQINAGFARTVLPEGRFRHFKAGGYLLIDDTYNANPLSMAATLEAAAEEARALGLPLTLVLGEMGELGTDSAERHFELGQLIARISPTAVFWKGAWLEQVRSGSSYSVIPLESPDKFMNDWRERALAAALVVFKGSRRNRLEEYVDTFKKRVGDQSNV